MSIKDKDISRIEREVEKTLACLEELGEIDPSPQFLSRVEARIKESRKEPIRSAAGARFLQGLRGTAFALLIVFNAVSVGYVLSIARATSGGSEAREASLTSMASEYGVTTATGADPFASLKED